MSFALFYAFTAGAVATVNPCGWALLPAWFARRLDDAGEVAPVLTAMRAGALATLGFIVIFGLAGSAIALGAVWLGPLLPYVGLAVGLVLAIVGIFMLTGRNWAFLPGSRTCRRVSERHGSLVFGFGYGLLSLSCTLPIFLAAIGISLTGTPLDLAVNLLVYALGMGTVLSALGILAASGGTSLGQISARSRLILDKVAAVLLLLAAAYVIYYWGRVVFGDVMVESAVVNAGDQISSTLRGWLAGNVGQKTVAVTLALLGLALLGSWLRTRTRPRGVEKESKH
jgi:cytochrome c-type biogenesis protein